MRREHTGDLVVFDDERVNPLGVITDCDIVVEVLGKAQDPGRTPVGSLIRRLP